MYITQNLNEKLKVPVMWKLSTAFFPCSKDAFTRPPGPSAGSSVTAVWDSTLLRCRVSLLGQQGIISGMVPAGPKLKPWLEGSHATGMGVRGTLGHAVELSPLLLSACAVPLLWSDLQQWGYWVSNELDALEGVRGSLVLWHFLTEPGSTCQDPALACHQSHCRSLGFSLACGMPHGPETATFFVV